MALKTGGAQGRMKTDSNLPLSNGVTIFMVAAQNVSGLSPDGQGVFLEYALDSEIKRDGSTTDVLSTLNSDSVGSESITDGVFYTMVVKTDGTDSTLYINGVSVGSGTAFSAPTEQPLYIFQNHLNANTGNKMIATIICYTKLVDDTERGQLETYLQETYNHY